MQQPKNIWAVGRNYPLHAKELGNEIPKEPFIFLKSGSCLQRDPDQILLFSESEIHYEVEVALALDANLNFSHWTLALDFTNRQRQQEAKTKGLPWTLAKSFKGACQVADWLPLTDFKTLQQSRFFLLINNELRQEGRLQDVLFSPNDLLTFLKQHFPCEPGDWLLTGTPAGVGALTINDKVTIGIDGYFQKTFDVHKNY